MTRSVFVAAAEGASVKSIVALGLVDLLTQQVDRVGVFRPVTSAHDTDVVVDLLLAHPGITQARSSAIGVTYDDVYADQNAARGEIVRKFAELQPAFDAIVILGSDYVDTAAPGELTFNARVAADLGAPVVLVVSGKKRSPGQVREVAQAAWRELAADHAQVAAIIASRVAPDDVALVRSGLESLHDFAGGGSLQMPVGVIEEVPVLVAPTVRSLWESCATEFVRGNQEWLDRESTGLVVAAMSLPHVLTRLTPGVTVIAPGDRSDLLPGLVLAHQAGTYGHLSSLVLTGGYLPSDPIRQLIDGLDQDLPIGVSAWDTFPTAAAMAEVRGRITAASPMKTQTALRIFAESIDGPALLDALQVRPSSVVTPTMFSYRLLERARNQRRHIVLPEGSDERILRATASLLRLGVADITLVGADNTIRAQAAALGVDIAGAAVASPTDPALVDEFAAQYALLRADKGMTKQRAREIVTDPTFFGTMMVATGKADGMVSGAVHTTADTLRPAFQIIKTAPGTSVVSSVFLMALADQVLVYGDCAVIPDPTAPQLADVAISAAETARQFGIDPRIAMLSYSTGSSGTGADVDKVREATVLVRSRRPDLIVDGPIQYDAAVDPMIAAAKAPGSAVAGHATVLIFPDLNTGNNTYKAVQRSAGAVAIGPVLQGLARPVNDLSRGATVADIVSTVAITAIQAQEQQ